MFRWKSIKNGVFFGFICWFLLLLNKSLVDDDRVHTRPMHAPSCPEVHSEDALKSTNVSEISCTADHGDAMRCLRDEEEVFFPFSFLKKHYDVSGKMSKDGNKYEWMTSHSKIRIPEGNDYVPSGEFGHFATYSVETRDRVRCINGETGVPMSTQWRTEPYYYPIQIAQYALQHYSKMVTDDKSSHRSISVGSLSRDWKGVPGDGDTGERIFYEDDGFTVFNISNSEVLSNAGSYVILDKDPKLHVVSFTWRPASNASFTILAKVIESDQLILLNYVEGYDEMCLQNDGVVTGKMEQLSFSISMGTYSTERWRHVTRDALVDASRSLASLSHGGKKKNPDIVLRPGDIRLVSLGFRGSASIRLAVDQTTDAHETAFLTSADWLKNNQNEEGCWSVPVERSIADRKLVLPAGWCSAMAQGHGLSVLTRAYSHSKKVEYVEAASKALKLFRKNATEGGVVNYFYGNIWYEEYPTTPGSFVLNGFMYALIGLYDMKQLKIDSTHDANGTLTEATVLAGLLFDTGFSSLKAMLPLYDTGRGSVYDLRHVGLNTAPNLARWDYHAVHVYLLKWLVQITNDRSIDTVADRWIQYSVGKTAKHNWSVLIVTKIHSKHLHILVRMDWNDYQSGSNYAAGMQRIGTLLSDSMVQRI